MKARFVLALVCTLVIGAIASIACGGSQPEPTTPSTADGGRVTNGTASQKPEKTGHEHEH